MTDEMRRAFEADTDRQVADAITRPTPQTTHSRSRCRSPQSVPVVADRVQTAPTPTDQPAPQTAHELTHASERLIRDWDRYPDTIDANELAARLWLIERQAAAHTEALDVRAVKQAVTNIAVRHDVVKDPPPPDWSLMHFYGYTAAPADMDAEIAREYAAILAAKADR